MSAPILYPGDVVHAVMPAEQTIGMTRAVSDEIMKTYTQLGVTLLIVSHSTTCPEFKIVAIFRKPVPLAQL